MQKEATHSGPGHVPVLSVKNVSYWYGPKQALDDVSFDVYPGKVTALLGPNGAGKTTLALHLNGILTAARGTIRVSGLEVGEPNLAEIRRRVGLVFQDSNDQLFMPSVREDIAFGPANLGVEGDELNARVDHALAAVEGQGLADRPPHHLSGGERRRAALATVLSMEPDILVFDEPSAGLDPAGRRELIETLRALPMTQLLITHDLPLAFELSTRAVIMREGRVVAEGPTLEILSDHELLAANRLEFPILPDLNRIPAE